MLAFIFCCLQLHFKRWCLYVESQATERKYLQRVVKDAQSRSATSCSRRPTHYPTGEQLLLSSCRERLLQDYIITEHFFGNSRKKAGQCIKKNKYISGHFHNLFTQINVRLIPFRMYNGMERFFIDKQLSGA